MKLPSISRVAEAITFCAGVAALVMAVTKPGLVVAGVILIGFAVHDFICESKQKSRQNRL